MDFDLNEVQKEIQSVARDLLTARSPWPRVREAAEAGAYDQSLWREIIDLGWPGIAVAEEHGGQGLGIVELAVVLEQLGYACAAVPFLSTAVVAAVLSRCGTDAQRERFLPGLLDGSTSAGLGRIDGPTHGGGLVADGEGAAVAVVGLPGGGWRVAVEPAAQPLIAIDPTRRFANLGAAALTEIEGETEAGALVALAIAAEVTGVCQRALEMSVAYVGDRKQFGVPVGSFQAVSHRCAEMLLHTESARSATYYAAWAADADPDRLGEAAALAAATAASGGRAVTASAIQAHGGIGFTWEADVHWLYKRAEVDRMLLGGPSAHHVALARSVAARLTAG